MPEESVGSSSAAPSTASSASQAPDTSSTNSQADKSETSNGQASASTAAKDQGTSGQASGNPDKAGKVDGAKGETQKPQWDSESLNWIQSKGIDAVAFDPQNQAHKQLITNALNAERAMTKAMQEAKSREVLDKAKIQVEKETPENKLKSPLDQYEESFQSEVNYTVNLLGYADVKELIRERPDLVDKFNKSYVVNRQKAWEDTQNWKTEQQKAAEKKASERLQLENDYKQMTAALKNNFEAQKVKNPAFEAVWRESGVEKVLDFLDKTHTLPKEFILHDPQIFQWFSEAAQAMEYRRHEGDRKAAWQQEYEQAAIKAKTAKFPSVDGTEAGAVADKNVSGVFDWTKNLPPFKK